MFFRSLLFNAVLYANFAILAVLFSPILILPQRWGWPVVRFWASTSLWWHRLICNVNETVSGWENRPEGGYIVACKHQSSWEAFRLVTLVDKPAFIVKRELMWIPLFGWYLAKFGQIPVNRGKRSAALTAMTELARRAIENGQQVIIFPEGTRRPAGAKPDYRYGIVHMYKTLGVPCVPVALNSGLYWPRRTMIHNSGTIVVEILPPIGPGLSGDEFAAKLKNDIESATDRLIEEARKRDPAVNRVLVPAK